MIIRIEYFYGGIDLFDISRYGGDLAWENSHSFTLTTKPHHISLSSLPPSAFQIC